MSASASTLPDAGSGGPVSRTVFLSDFLHIATPWGQLASELADSGEGWLQRLRRANSGGGSGTEVVNSIEVLPSGVAIVELDVGPLSRGLSVPVRLQLGPPRRSHDSVLVPISWTPRRLGSVLPHLDGHLELLPLEESGTSCRLGLYASYKVPLGSPGMAVDKLALRRVAEATMRGFLADVREALGVSS